MQHESSVNFKNLIQDLADMYSYPIPEVVLTEIVANALDAKASRIAIDYDINSNTLVVLDNGEGMSKAQFEEYHDIAAGLKTRGASGIGFAGVGAKISFNVAERVLTETVSESFRGGSDWYLKGKKLIWDDSPVKHLHHSGTRVEVKFKSNIAPYGQSAALIQQTLLRHYLPLLDPVFLEFYAEMGIYSRNLEFRLNGKSVDIDAIDRRFGLSRVKRIVPKTRAGKRCALGVFGLIDNYSSLDPDRNGVLLCTHGKVIKPDMFNQFPGEYAFRILGVVEVPGFISFLTTSKSDFTRGKKGKEFNLLYEPIRSEFKEWLNELGVKTTEFESDTETRSLERELKRIAQEIPEIGQFFGYRDRTRVLTGDPIGTQKASEEEGAEATYPVGGDGPISPDPVTEPGEDPGVALRDDGDGSMRAKPISRKARKGPRITFLEAHDRWEMSWVDGDYICINKAHSAYVRSENSGRTLRLHNMFAIGSAIQRFLAKESGEPDLGFIDRLMGAWGKK